MPDCATYGRILAPASCILAADAHSRTSSREARLSDSDPIVFRPRAAHRVNSSASSTAHVGPSANDHSPQISFNRQELTAILAVYGRKVASGEWRDYAIDLTRDKAVFSVFRRACEVPLFRIEKDPKLARKQGAFSVIAAGGLIVKRGHDLPRVLSIFDTSVAVIGR